MNRTKILILTAAYVIVFSSYGCKKNDQPKPEAGGTRTETAITQTTAAHAKGTKVKEQKKAYISNESYFKLPLYKGGEIDLASYAGKPMMLMFFTEGCPFCRKAAPFIETMNKKYSPKGLGVIGICVEDEASAAEGFAKDFGLTFPVAYGGAEVSRKYKTQGVPYIFLLNKAHVVHNVWAGYDPEFDKSITQGVEEVIK